MPETDGERMKVWKETLPSPVPGKYRILLAWPGSILSFGTDPEGALAVWYAVKPVEDRPIYKTVSLKFTGDGFNPATEQYVGTAVRGNLVYHLFEVIAPETPKPSPTDEL